MALPAFVTPPAAAQTPASVAIQRGYRTGYSDGYMAGYRDTIDSLAKSYARHGDYAKADRAFNKDYGSIEDYRDGYQQGFESGYDTGFERKSFESTLPASIQKRGAISAASIKAQASETTASQPVEQPKTPSEPFVPSSDSDSNAKQPAQASQPQNAVIQSASYTGPTGPTIIIPRDTELILELQEDLNTEQSREGERFTARIVSPSELAGATIEGRVSKVIRPGKFKRHSELSLSYDRIILEDGRWSNFSAQMIEVMGMKGDNIRRVDNEGTAIGKSSLKRDAAKVGGATGAGLITGAIIGGPVGAAVGAGMGAAFGVGAVVIDRGKHVRLARNQQVRIRTGYETQIR